MAALQPSVQGVQSQVPLRGFCMHHQRPAGRTWISQRREIVSKACQACLPAAEPSEEWQPSSTGRQGVCTTSSRAEQLPGTARQLPWTPAHLWRRCVPLGLAAAVHQFLLQAMSSAQASEGLSSSAIPLFRQFLEQIDSLGPWGGVLFTCTVMSAEMVPLFPTQPLSLASGLLFGPKKGALLMLLGVSLAAFNAYHVARGVGRQLAEKVIKAEMEGEEAGPVGQQVAKVTAAIESGGFVRQTTAVMLLRLTPVVPYSASNYLLGLTPLPLAPYMLGTCLGMSIWCVLYASLGGASRMLLDSGVELEVLLADMVEQASKYTKDVAILGVLVVALLLVYYLISSNRIQHDKAPTPEAPVDREEALQRK